MPPMITTVWWHVWFSSAIDKHYPDIWKFLQCLQNEQASVEVTHQQFLAGRHNCHVNKKFVSVQKRLRHLRSVTTVKMAHCCWVHYWCEMQSVWKALTVVVLMWSTLKCCDTHGWRFFSDNEICTFWRSIFMLSLYSVLSNFQFVCSKLNWI